MRCGVETTIDIIGGRWKIIILINLLRSGGQKSEEFCKRINGINQEVLTQQLYELEEDGLVDKRTRKGFPAYFEYTLTDTGRKLKEALVNIHN